MNVLKKGRIPFECICLGIVLCFIGFIFLSGLLQSGHKNKAISSSIETVQAAISDLPKPSKLLKTSKIHSNPVLKGIKLNPKDPFKLEFIIDTEDNKDISEEELSIVS